MLLEHRGKRPRVHESACVAPTATVCGDVTIGENSRVLFGAVLTAEGGPVEIGAECTIMENAVVRGTAKHPVRVGDHVLVGPRAYLTGCTVENVFLATGSTVFNGARIGEESEIRINGVVHLRTVLPGDSLVPIGPTRSASLPRSCRRRRTRGYGPCRNRWTSRARCSG